MILFDCGMDFSFVLPVVHVLTYALFFPLQLEGETHPWVRHQDICAYSYCVPTIIILVLNKLYL